MSEERVKILFFGAAADRAGTRETDVSAQPGATLDDLFDEVSRSHPDLAPMRATLAFAVNGEYAERGSAVSPGDEVAFLPPVSGG